MIVSFLYWFSTGACGLPALNFSLPVNICAANFFSASLSGKLSCVQGASFQDYGASKDVVSATIMLCLAEINDIGLEICDLECVSIPIPNSAFFRLRKGSAAFIFTNSSFFY